VQLAVFPRRYRAIGALAPVCLALACGDSEEPRGFATTLAECGTSLDVLLRAAPDENMPGIGASYSEALEEWSLGGDYCGLGVFAGECSDGKRLLYRNGGFTSEIRYFDGERLVGVVASGDIAVCPSVCPSSNFFGAVEDVRCEAPTLEELCPGSSQILGGQPLFLPFANGEPPGGCDAL
jgi:hypothetical protein